MFADTTGKLHSTPAEATAVDLGVLLRHPGLGREIVEKADQVMHALGELKTANVAYEDLIRERTQAPAGDLPATTKEPI